MGSSKKSPGHYNDEKLDPQTLSDFYIGKYEVTVADFARFIEETDYQTEAEKGDGSVIKNHKGWWEQVSGVNWRHDVEGNKRPFAEYDHPVVHVSWNDATAYCKWLREKRESIITSHPKPNGNMLPEAGRTKIEGLFIFEGYNDGFAYTSPVGTFPANELGAYDMTGNVWE